MALSPIEPAVFAALADSTRRALFEQLAKQPRAVSELAAAFPITRSAVSQHLKVLREAGLVRETRRGKFVVYSIQRETLAALERYARSLDSGTADTAYSDDFDRELQKQAATWPGIDPVFSALLTWTRASQRILDHLLEDVAAAYGIGSVDIFILGVLHRIGPPHESTPTNLSKISIQSLPGMTRRLDNLERLGLITRLTSPNDGRSRVVRLSAKGSTLLHTVVHAQFERARGALAVLGGDEQRELARLMRKLLAGLQESQHSARDTTTGH